MNHHQRTILLVEDDPGVQDMLTLVLVREGFAVARVGNGQEALAYLRGQPAPDVIVLDLSMPVMDGWSFRVEQRKDPRLAAIPTIVASGESNLREYAQLMGAAGYLTKPLHIETLLETVNAAAGISV